MYVEDVRNDVDPIVCIEVSSRKRSIYCYKMSHHYVSIAIKGIFCGFE
jgi:hypothetical protein